MTKEQVHLLCLSQITAGILSNNTFLELAHQKNPDKNLYLVIADAAMKQLEANLEAYGKALEAAQHNEGS